MSEEKEKGKAPSFPWYPNDFEHDLSKCTPPTVGIWTRCLNQMWWENPQGKLSMPREHYLILCRCSDMEFQKFLDENKVFGFADVTFRNTSVRKITVTNRRMFAAWKKKNQARIRQEKHRKEQASTQMSHDCNKSVQAPDPLLSSSSSSSSSNKETKQRSATQDYTEDFIAFWDPYPRKLHKPAAFLCWKTRLKQGVKPSDLISAAGNYAKHVKGRTLNHMLLASTFLGPQELFADYIDGVPEVDNTPKCGNCEGGPPGNSTGGVVSSYCSTKMKTVASDHKACGDKYRRRDEV